MKKGALGVVWCILISCILSSCNNGKSLQEMLQEEQKAIDRFIRDNDLVILKDYPSDSVFKENEYYRTTDGLFFQVVDSGNGTRVQPLNQVCVRYDYSQSVENYASGDTSKFTFPNVVPYTFVYGVTSTYWISGSEVCQAWVEPLSYVGENAVVNMIIPSAIGSADNNGTVTPMFYKNLHYTKFN
jgi:hypothetical protein